MHSWGSQRLWQEFVITQCSCLLVVFLRLSSLLCSICGCYKLCSFFSWPEICRFLCQTFSHVTWCHLHPAHKLKAIKKKKSKHVLYFFNFHVLYFLQFFSFLQNLPTFFFSLSSDQWLRVIILFYFAYSS